jgi:hypothetical protein
LNTKLIGSDFSYSTKDFQEPIITNKDKIFLQNLMEQHQGWKSIANIKETEKNPKIGEIFTSKTQFFPNISSLAKQTSTKYEIVLPFEFEHVLCCSLPLSQQKRTDSSILSYESSEVQEESGKCSTTFTQLLSFSKILSKRIISCVSEIEMDWEKGSCLYISKPYEHEFLQDVNWTKKKSISLDNQNTKMYKMFDFKCIFIEKLGPNLTKFTQINLFSLGGWMKKEIFLRDINLQRGNDCILGLLENLKRKKSIRYISELKTKKFYKEDGVAKLIVTIDELSNISKEEILEKSLDEYTDLLESK